MLAVITLCFSVIWQGTAYSAAPVIASLGQIDQTFGIVLGMAVDTSGNLYVSDVDARAIYRYDSYGNLAQIINVTQSKGEGLAVDETGRIFVSTTSNGDYAADQVVVLDAAGNQIGVLGQGPGEFVGAGDIAIDINGNIYVADRGAKQVKVYAPNLSGGTVFAGKSFSGSIDMTIDRVNNQIYVANYNYNSMTGEVPTLFVFDAGGVQLQALAAPTAFGNDSLSRFAGMTFDTAGRFYIGDFTWHSIRVLDSNFTQVLKYTDNVYQSGVMTFDATNGLLYVARANSRINILSVDGGAVPQAATNTPPSVPTAITMGEVASLNPVLAFNGSTDAEGDVLTYNLRVLDNAGVEVDALTLAEGETAVVATTLIENAQYSWQIQANDGKATSEWSAPLNIYINATQEAPSAPVLTSLLAGEAANSSTTLNWDAATDADPNASLNYRVEITQGAALVASHQVSGTISALSAFAADLQPGTAYSWNVVAVDNTALETPASSAGSFVFQATLLTIDANVAGARVSLGGHHGYAGRFVGVTPLQVRDLAAGSYAVVVEAAGFEPAVVNLALAQDAQSSFTVD